MDYFNQETERFKLRALTLEDINSWSEFFEGNDRLRFLGLDSSVEPKELATNWVNKQLGRYRDYGRGMLAAIDEPTGDIVGCAGVLDQVVNEKKYVEIGYSVKPKYWGKGIATELATCLKKFAWEQHWAEHLVSMVHEDNLASAKVAMKNGMREIERTEYKDMPIVIFGISRSE